MASNMFALGLLLTTLVLLLPGSIEKSIKQAPKTTKQIVAVCFLPKVEGMCTAYFPRFYFDQKSKKCEKFVYGGCGGNQNNFLTEKECKYKCATTSVSAQAATVGNPANKTTTAPQKKSNNKSSIPNKPCLINKKNAIATNKSFVPECDKNGDYLAKQCWIPLGISDTQCWCVDKKGSRVGDVKILLNGKETCNKTHTTKKRAEESECLNLVNSYHQNIPAEHLRKMYVPQCDDFTGQYKSRQCHYDSCWCVDTSTGKLVEDSLGTKLTVKCPMPVKGPKTTP